MGRVFFLRLQDTKTDDWTIWKCSYPSKKRERESEALPIAMADLSSVIKNYQGKYGDVWFQIPA